MTCGDARPALAGRYAELSGWVAAVRVLGDGLVFLSLRDAYGSTQVVVERGAAPGAGAGAGAAPPPPAAGGPAWAADVHAAAAGLRPEAIVHVAGVLRARPAARAGAGATGGVELAAAALRVLASPGRPLEVLPAAAPADAGGPAEETRLRARYLDLRRPALARNLRLRSAVTAAARRALLARADPPFLEVETPALTRASPEGAREFLVPASRAPGRAYALAQSPQQFKQLLMAAGVDRYFQVARCFRDEAGRADRQPEFTQLDIELAFARARDVQDAVEDVLAAAVEAAAGRDVDGYGGGGGRESGGGGGGGAAVDVDAGAGGAGGAPRRHARPAPHPPLVPWAPPPRPLPRLTYAHCVQVYGSDKPDRRVGMPIFDVSALAARAWDARAPALGPAAAAAVAALADAARAPGRHARLAAPAGEGEGERAAGWLAPEGDADLAPLAPGEAAVRAFAARGLGAALSRAEGDALAAELRRAAADAAAGAGGGGADGGGVALFTSRVGAGGELRDGHLAKALSARDGAALARAAGAQPGDWLVVSAGPARASAAAAGVARLAAADAARLVAAAGGALAAGVELRPHGTAVRVGPRDAVAHALASAVAAALPARARAGGRPPAGGADADDGDGGRRALDVFWVTDFPMFVEESGAGGGGGGGGEGGPAATAADDDDEGSGDAGDGGLAAAHHPFTAPVPEHAAALAAAAGLPRGAPGRARALLALRAAAYDLVANGVELGGGSERIADARLQRLVLERVLLPPRGAAAGAEAAGFGPLLAALDAGAPPHAGAALGLDRLVAMLAGPEAAASVRDVIAFPKSAAGACALTGAPA